MPGTIRAALAGRYVLERELGRGASAIVYAAHDLKHGRRVALKVLNSPLPGTAGTERFLREIRTAARLSHPHILPLFDSGEVDGRTYYTMPLVQGESLRRRIDRLGPMPLDRALPLLDQVAAGLAYAHSTGVVHRDVKPENILVDERDHVWIADFGLARALATAGDQRLTATAMAVGSPRYISPEQAAGEHDVDGRSDLYSLACVTFEMLCGEPPFDAGSVAVLLARHVADPAPSVRDRRPDVSAAVDAALRRALAKDRTHRFREPLEFVAALRGQHAPERADGSVMPESHSTLADASAEPHPFVRSMRRLLDRLRTLLNGGAGAQQPMSAIARDEPQPAASGPVRRDRAALPTAATPFIGRDDELRELHELLRDPACRLVTVTGPGGVGKTRLGLQVAEQLEPTFRDGVAYCAMSGLASADLLVPALAEAAGIQLSRREDPLDELKAYLHQKQLLILIDNFEHLTAAAGQLATLLDHAPDVRMLVTSRERLNLQHETLLALDGLGADQDDDGSDAVRLFVAGARRLDRRFELNDDNRACIVRICALLDGIPLAIELASAWVRALSCVEILAELRNNLDMLNNEAPDLEQRHHSMRATFDASWHLLTAPEQTTLARLGVFRGAFDRAAAAHVADADAHALRELVDKSLLTRAGDRLLMLDVIRAYALERLAADAPAERRARERHLGHFTTLLSSMQPRVQRGHAEAIGRIAESIDDVRAAWEHAVASHNTAAMMRGLDGLFHFYDARGWAREGADTFARSRRAITSGSGAGGDRVAQLTAARLDVRHGVLAHRLGELQQAETLLRRGVATARDLGEQGEVVFALHRLGAVRHGMGDYSEAEQLHEEACALARAMNDRLATGWSMTYLGNVAWSRGEFDRATQLYSDAHELLQAEHDVNGMWVALNNLGVIAAGREQYAEAQRRFREALALLTELNNPRQRAHLMHNLGCAARYVGDLADSHEYLRESLEISDRMGYQSMAGLTLVALGELAILEDDEAAGTMALHRALRIGRAGRNHPLVLEALLALARLRLRQGDRREAITLASVIAKHPGSDRDVRLKSAAMLDEAGAEWFEQTSTALTDATTAAAGLDADAAAAASGDEAVRGAVSEPPAGTGESAVSADSELDRLIDGILDAPAPTQPGARGLSASAPGRVMEGHTQPREDP